MNDWACYFHWDLSINKNWVPITASKVLLCSSILLSKAITKDLLIKAISISLLCLENRWSNQRINKLKIGIILKNYVTLISLKYLFLYLWKCLINRIEKRLKFILTVHQITKLIKYLNILKKVNNKGKQNNYKNRKIT